MLTNRQYLALVLAMILTSGCAKQDLSTAATISSCDNTFVVSADKWIKLFEHEPGGVNIKLVRDISVPEGGVGGANFICGRNEIISDYDFRQDTRGLQDHGIEIHKLDGGMEHYQFKEGASLALPYRNGVLFHTMLLHKEPIDPSLGFLTMHEQATDTPLTAGGYVFGGAKDSAQATHHVFTWTHFFDLDQRKVTRSYRQDATAGEWLEGDTLILRSAALMSVDLKTGRRTAIYEFDPARDRVPHNEMPILRIAGKFYSVTSSRVGKVDGFPPDFPRKFRKCTIYALENGEWRKRVRLPYSDITYVADQGEFIYVFTRASGKVLRYDTKSNKLDEIAFDTGGKAVIAASYTKDNFVLVLGVTTRPPERHGQYHTMASMMVVSNDFQQRSQPVDFGEVAEVRVTTQPRHRAEGFFGRLNELEE